MATEVPNVPWTAADHSRAAAGARLASDIEAVRDCYAEWMSPMVTKKLNEALAEYRRGVEWAAQQTTRVAR